MSTQRPSCAFCGDPFTDEQWDARHEPGTVHVHAECCDPCPSDSDLSDAAADHVFGQGRGLKRDDGRPTLVGRDVPTGEQLALTEALGVVCDCPRCLDTGALRSVEDVRTGGLL